MTRTHSRPTGGLLGLVAGLVLSAGALHAASHSVELPEPEVVIPIDHQSGHVGVDVYIDGEGPYLFQVDTYASIGACIDDDLARELELPVVGTVLNNDGRNTHTRNVVNIGSIQLGDATFGDVRTLVDDYDWIGTRKGRKVSGLLGFTLFEELLVTFYYPGSRLLRSRERIAADDPHSLAIRVDSGAPDIHLDIGGEQQLVGIDTGHGGALSLRLEDVEELSLHDEPVRIGQARTVYTTYDIYGARLAAPLKLAQHRIQDLDVTFSEGSTRALMGYGLLVDYVVSFDQRSRRVRFLLPEAPADP